MKTKCFYFTEKEIFTAAGHSVAVGITAVPRLALRHALPPGDQRRPQAPLSQVASKYPSSIRSSQYCRVRQCMCLIRASVLYAN